MVRLIRRVLIVTKKVINRLKFSVAQLVALMLSLFIKKPIWLIGENLGETAQDNGLAFFEYCINYKNKDEKVCYVARKNNKNHRKLYSYKEHLVIYDSFKHCVLYTLAEYLIVSHGIRDVMPSARHKFIPRNKKNIIYLQHGIIAMKKLYFDANSYNGKIKKFVVSSEFEKDILINEMHFKQEQVMITGLSRYDKLHDQSYIDNYKSILIIPTWREWLLDDEAEFIESFFYKSYANLLENEELLELLERANMVINFYPHIEMQKKYSHLFKSSGRINIVDVGTMDVKDLLEKASLMVTDYSSVAFDFNYMKKPVIFYQFDLDEYTHHRGSYIDMKSELFGDVVYTEAMLLNSIKHAVESNFYYSDSSLRRSKRYYLDSGGLSNSERTYNEIKVI